MGLVGTGIAHEGWAFMEKQKEIAYAYLSFQNTRRFYTNFQRTVGRSREGVERGN